MFDAIDIESMIERQTEINNIYLINEEVILGSKNDLKKLSNKLSCRFISGIAIFSALINEKPVVSISVSKDLIKKSLSASFLAKIIGKELHGGGGGKDNFATAGASPKFSLNDIKKTVNKLVTGEMEKL